VAVGYMDPGNWATDLAAGSAYGYNQNGREMLSRSCANCDASGRSNYFPASQGQV